MLQHVFVEGALEGLELCGDELVGELCGCNLHLHATRQVSATALCDRRPSTETGMSTPHNTHSAETNRSAETNGRTETTNSRLSTKTVYSALGLFTQHYDCCLTTQAVASPLTSPLRLASQHSRGTRHEGRVAHPCALLQLRVDTCDKLLLVHGLGHVVLRTGSQAVHDVLRLAV